MAELAIPAINVDIGNFKGLGSVSVNLQEKSAIPGSSSQTVTPDSGYSGLSAVVISGDSDLTAENIKAGVEIFGIAGQYEQIATVDSVPLSKETDIVISSGDYYVWRD